MFGPWHCLCYQEGATGDRGEPSAGATLKAVVVGTSDHSHLVALVNEMFLGRFRDIALSMLRGSKVIIGVFFIVGDGIPAHFGDFHALTRTTIALAIWRRRRPKSWQRG